MLTGGIITDVFVTIGDNGGNLADAGLHTDDTPVDFAVQAFAEYRIMDDSIATGFDPGQQGVGALEFLLTEAFVQQHDRAGLLQQIQQKILFKSSAHFFARISAHPKIKGDHPARAIAFESGIQLGRFCQI